MDSFASELAGGAISFAGVVLGWSE